MALMLAVCALKGGVGKTTVALNVASCLYRAGHRALVIDADSQASCVMWKRVADAAQRDAPPVVEAVGKMLRTVVEARSSEADVIVIDAPPRLGEEARAAMLAADLVLLPVTPGAADVWALRSTLELLEQARKARPELRAAVLLNRVNARRTVSGTARTTVEKIDGVTTLRHCLGDRAAFVEAMALGQGVIDYAPRSPAAIEARDVTAEALALLGAKRRR